MSIKIPLVLLAVLSLSVFSATAKTYKWVDEKGVVQYTQTPPRGRQATEMNIKTSQPRPPHTPKPARKPEPPAAPPLSDDNGAATRPEPSAARAENCDTARHNLYILEHNQRIRVEEDGAYRIISEAERARKIESTREQLKTFCE